MTQRILSGVDYLSQPSGPDTWLIKPLLPTSGAMLIYADPKAGKSYLALQLAQAIESGSSWLGFPCRAGSVVYIQLDTPRNVWQDRIKTLVQAGSMTQLPSFADRESLNTWPFNILQPDHLIMLREALKSVTRVNMSTGEDSLAPPDLVIIDTLRESHQGDENDSTEMQEVVAALVAATQPAALLLISHSRKPSQDGDFSLMNDSRGSSYVVGRMDAIVRLTPKSARIAGRSIEEHSIELERLDSGFWDVPSGENDTIMTALLLDPTIPSLRQKAKILAARIGKSESACRGMLRRFATSRPNLGGGI
jgi:RecA-family ATPase